MKFRIFASFVFIACTSFGQVGTGQWRVHVTNRKALDVAAVNGLVYGAFENGLLEYDINEKESSLLTYANSLSDLSLTCLGTMNNSVYVGYSTGNIDKITNGNVVNIPALKLSQLQGNKQINRFVENGNYLYAATGIGILQINPGKNEVKNTFYPTTNNEEIIDIAFYGDTIFALTTTELLKGRLSNPVINDPTQWSVDSRIPAQTTDSYKDIEIIDGKIYVNYAPSDYGNDSIYVIDNGTVTSFFDASVNLEIYSISQHDDQLIINTDGAYYVFNSDGSQAKLITSYNFGEWISLLNSTVYNGQIWFADQYTGIYYAENDFKKVSISFNGPPRNSYYKLDWKKGKLAVTGGGLSGHLPTYNVSGIYTMEDESWSLIAPETVNLWNNGTSIWDFIAVAINPNNANQIAVGTYSTLPLTILNGSGQADTTFTAANSTLQINSSDQVYTMINDLQYDDNGNLWVLNSYTSTPLNVYTKAGEWKAFNAASGSTNSFGRCLAIDNDGNKWFAIDDGGLYGYNDNGTITTTSDDETVVLNSGTTTGNLPSDIVTALAVDQDGELWVGTDSGFGILYNPTAAFTASAGNYNLQRPKTTDNNIVSYVLGSTSISCIVVDGGNRKWIGTSSSGIFLLSADGLEVIEQHTAEDSPLPSNAIIDMAINETTGELFIVTDRGMVSYRTDASTGDSEYSDVKVFPNPVRPGFSGVITIQGIQTDSDVKVTDVAGNLVYKTTSNGGTATWDGKTLNGDKVPTGVYLFWTAPNEGNGKKVGKVLILN